MPACETACEIEDFVTSGIVQLTAPSQVDAALKQMVGKRIAVKWASKGGKNFMLTAGMTGPAEFYSGKILRFDSTKRRYQVTFDDQKSKKYDVNLTDPKSADYLPQKNWKRL